MTDRIEPALDLDQWAELLPQLHEPFTGAADMVESRAWGSEWPAVIALANAALPDSDPRKITRERVAALREVAKKLAEEPVWWLPNSEPLEVLADALASYLPPEGA